MAVGKSYFKQEKCISASQSPAEYLIEMGGVILVAPMLFGFVMAMPSYWR